MHRERERKREREREMIRSGDPPQLAGPLRGVPL
jgi:hypothetical protein